MFSSCGVVEQPMYVRMYWQKLGDALEFECWVDSPPIWLEQILCKDML